MTYYVQPPFLAEIPVWPHGDPHSYDGYFERAYKHAARERVWQTVAEQEKVLAASNFVGFGTLWIPDPTTGIAVGSGRFSSQRVARPGTLDEVLGLAASHRRERGEKVHELSYGAIGDLALGPAGFVYLSRTLRASRTIDCVLSVFVMLSPTAFVECRIAYRDPLHDVAVRGHVFDLMNLSVVVDKP